MRDGEKESFWKKQLDLWQKSGLSVRAFCKERGIVETSFYAWRRELIIRARESGSIDYGSGQDELPATPNTVKDGRGRTISVRFRQPDHQVLHGVANDSAGEAASPFVPLTIVTDSPATTQAKSIPAHGSVGIAITTPSGYRISVSSQDDLYLLEQILNIVEENKC